MALDIDAALTAALKLGASDVHVKVPSPPRVRLTGELVPLPGFGPVTPEDTYAVLDRVLKAGARRQRFEDLGAADLSYYTEDGRFRVSTFKQRNSPSFVFRAIPTAPAAESLKLPDVFSAWADELRGLIVVTGPTGSGKSTTCAAIIDMVNRRRRCHVLTIEDPIEFLHTDRKALVCQREIGSDAPSYEEALRAAMRQDPDVIMVGEIRDEETAMTALRAAETGHLVLCTMHTMNAAETVQRFVDLFGESKARLARQMLAATLVGISAQRLVPGTDGRRKLNAEILVNSSRIRDLIGEAADPHEVTKAIAAGEYYGMRTFDQDLLTHIEAGRVARDVAVAYASNAHDFKLTLMAAGIDVLGSPDRASV